MQLLRNLMRWVRKASAPTAQARLDRNSSDAAAIFFGSLGDRTSLLSFLSQIEEGDRKRVHRRVKALQKWTDALLVSDSGSRTMEEHFEWMVQRLRRRHPWIDDQVLPKLRHYCSWAAWHG